MKRSATAFALLPLGKSFDHAVLWSLPVLAKRKEHVYFVITIFCVFCDYYRVCKMCEWFIFPGWLLKSKVKIRSFEMLGFVAVTWPPVLQTISHLVVSCSSDTFCSLWAAAHQAYSWRAYLFISFVFRNEICPFIYSCCFYPLPHPTPSKKMAFFGTELLYLWYWSQETGGKGDMVRKLTYLDLLLQFLFDDSGLDH